MYDSRASMRMCNGGFVTYRACRRGTDLIVSLTPAEINDAAAHGNTLYRHSQVMARRGQMREKGSFARGDSDGHRAQMIGALAECAGAKAVGVLWPKHIDNFKEADLPHNIEVRLIGNDDYGLRVYQRDIDSRRVLGIIIPKGCENRPYRIPGWINAIHAKKPEWLADPLGKNEPVYLVPQERLHPIGELLELIRRENPD